MAYPVHWYLVFGGTYGVEEEWQCGIRFAGGDPADAGVFTPAVTDLADDVKAFVSSAGAKFTTQAKLTYIKFNKIGPDGKYLSPSEANTVVYSPSYTGTNTVKMPPQCALTVTLLTDADRGPASKGRFYWLGGGFALGTAGEVASADLTAFGNAAWAFVQDLGNWAGLDMTGLAPAVVSNVGAGSWRKVTGVRVDQRVDTQRRRARSAVHGALTLP